VIEDLIKDDCRGGTRKRVLARGHFVENRAERKQIAARVEFEAARLFGGHVGDRAEGRTGTGEVGDVSGLGERSQSGQGSLRTHLGETEIENLHLAGRDQKDVSGLDVAVDDALAVSGIERVGELDGDFEDTIQGERPALQDGGQALAFEQLHGDERRTAVLVDLMNRADIRVIQCGSGASFAIEALERDGILRKFFGDEFQGDAAAKFGVLGCIDHTHPAAANPYENAVVGDRIAD
jgi:hypothetical protein